MLEGEDASIGPCACVDKVALRCEHEHAGWSKPSEKAAGVSFQPGAGAARLGFWGLLDGMKAAGIDSHPHSQSAESYAAGQACLFLFSAQMMVMAAGHWGQLVTDERFVYEADALRPHHSETLRFVRVLDFVVLSTWSVLLAGLAWLLRSKRITPAHGRKAVMVSMAMAVLAYLFGAAVDYLQCHFQAGGIGSHCHGFFCIQTAALLSICVAVGTFHPRLLFMCCFGIQGALRLEWASRAERPGALRATVSALAVTLIVLPIVAYFQEISSLLTGADCMATKGSMERDIEGGAPQRVAKMAEEPAHHTQPCVYVEGKRPEDMLRSKEDDARVGGGSKASESQDGGAHAALAGQSSRTATAREAFSVAASLTAQDQHGKVKHTDRKRKRREEQNMLVATLDRILPEHARRGGFKGAGLRSPGVWGRSFLNVLTDTIEHVKSVRSGGAASKPKTLTDLSLTYCDGA